MEFKLELTGTKAHETELTKTKIKTFFKETEKLEIPPKETKVLKILEETLLKLAAFT